MHYLMQWHNLSQIGNELRKKMVKKEEGKKACGVLWDLLFWYDDSRLYWYMGPNWLSIQVV
jgi:hypothetical protein